MKNKIEYYVKKNRLIQFAYVMLFSLIFRFISLFIKIDPKLILFNGHGKRYNDSPRVIFEQMLNDAFFKDFKFVWAVDKHNMSVIYGATVVKQDTLKYFIVSLKSKFWISCVNIERGLKYKKRKTVYLNTWHGIPLKYVGNKVCKRNDFNFSHIDLFCASGEYDKRIYIDDFKVKSNSIIMSGLPRNDELYYSSNTKVDELKNKLNIPKNKKIVLYAPTWRESGERDVRTSLTPPISIDKWKKMLSDDFLVLFKAHPYTSKYLNIEFDFFIRDMSNFDNINELMIVSDVLISDYSATIVDYSILKKPILCFGYDYDEYKSSRGLYIELNDVMPYGVIQDENIVIEKLINIDDYDLSLVTSLNSYFFDVGHGATMKCVEEIKKRGESI